MNRKITNGPLFAAGASLALGGLVAASPLDEAAAAVATGGLALGAVPVQAPATLVGGLATAALGGLLMYAATSRTRGRR